MRASTAPIVYASKDGRMNDLVVFLFPDQMTTVTLVNGAHFLQLILESNRRKIQISFVNMTTSTIFQLIIFFDSLSVFNDGL